MRQRHEPVPIDVIELFGEDRAALLQLLDALTEADWHHPTVCKGWSVRDVAAHVLGGDLGNVSRRRDRYTGVRPHPGEDIVALVNRLNDDWMRAAQRLSPRLIRELLEFGGPPMFAYFASLDLSATGDSVSWAGPQPAPVWLDVAREYTERWHHQQHIRDAVGSPGQTEPRYLHPVLATFAYALPHALRELPAADGTVVHWHVSGPAGGDWTVLRSSSRWTLETGAPANAAAASVELEQDQAWRLFTKGLGPEEVNARVTGDERLGSQLLRSVAIIA
jgi:uncharacterized protein (TIGR03083 family)